MSQLTPDPKPRLTLAKLKNYCGRLSFYGLMIGSLFAVAHFASGAAVTLTWDASTAVPGDGPQDGSGTWNSSTVNWWNGTADQAWMDSTVGTPVFAQFGAGTAATTRTVTVGGTFQVAGLVFGALPGVLSATNPGYTLSGGVINIDNGGTISFANTASGSAAFTTIGSVLGGNDITIQKSTGTAEQFLALTGAKTWGGTLTISGANGGMFVRSLNSSVFNSLTTIVVQSGATLNLQGLNNTYTSNFVLAGSGSGGAGARGAIRFENDMTLSGLITLAGNTVLNFQNSSAGPSNVVFTGGITESGGSFSFTKTGTGTLTLRSSSNYTGTTSVAVAVTGADPGTLRLDFQNQNVATAITDNLLYHGVTAGALALTGNAGRTQDVSTATLDILGADGAANTQTFNGVTVTGPTAISAASGTQGGSMNLSLGAITRSGTGTTLAITGPSTGSITTTTNLGTLLGTWTTFTIDPSLGVTWAGVDTSGVIGSFLGDRAYVTGTSLSGAPYSSTSNLFFSNTSAGAVTQGAGTTTINTITMRATNTDRVVTVGTGNTLALGQLGGIQLLLGSRSLTIGAAGNAGTLTAGTAAGAELFVSNFDSLNLITINSVIANNAGGALNVSLNGSGTTVFTGANTYTGATSIDSGILEIQSDAALGSTAGATLVASGATLQLTGGRNIAENMTINGVGAAGVGALFSKSGNNTSNGLIALGSDGAEISAAAGSTLTLFRTSAATTVINGTHNVVFGGGGTIVVGSVIAIGTGAVTKNDSGTLVMNAANTYTGTTTINAGVIQISTATGLGTTAAGTTVNTGGELQLIGNIAVGAESLSLGSTGVNNGGGLRSISGNNSYAGVIALKAASRINADAGTLTLTGGISGAFGLTFGGAGNVTFTNAITTSSVTKDGSGTLTLGASNLIADTAPLTISEGTFAMGTFSDTVGAVVMRDASITGTGVLTSTSFVLQNGSVSVSLAGTGATLNKTTSGTVTLSGANTYTGATQVSAGRLILDYSGGVTVIPAANAINLAGGTLEVNGGTGPTAVTLGAMATVGATGLSSLVVDANTTVTAASYVRNSGSIFFIDLSAAGSALQFTAAPVVSNGQITATGGNAAVVMKDGNGRYDFAALGAGNKVVRLNAATQLVATGGVQTTPYVLTANNNTFSIGADETISSLRIDTTGGGGTLDLNGHNLTLSLFGILNDGSGDYSIIDSGTGGKLTGASAVFIYQYGTGKLTLGATINSPQAFLMGTGLIDWTAASGGNGANHIYGATVRLSGSALTLDASIPSGNGTGVINIGSNGILELATGDLTRAVGTGTNNVNFIDDGGGFSAFGGNRIVNLGGAGATLTWGGTGGFLASGNKLILGSPYANAVVDFQNSLNLNSGNQTVEVQSQNVTGIGGKISGNISGTGNFNKTGQGILNLSGSNTYVGATNVKAGTLLVTGSVSGTTAVNVSSGAELKLSGLGAISANTLSLFDSSKLSLEVGTLTANTISLTGSATLSGTITLALTLTADPTDGTLFTLIDGGTAVAGLTSGGRFFADGHVLNEGSTFTVTTGAISEFFQISYVGGSDGNDVTVRAISSVPEPSTGAVLIASLGVLLGLNRFRRRVGGSVAHSTTAQGRVESTTPGHFDA